MSCMMQRLHCELPDAIIRQIPNCGHIPYVEKPDTVANLITDFAQQTSYAVPMLRTKAMVST